MKDSTSRSTIEDQHVAKGKANRWIKDSLIPKKRYADGQSLIIRSSTEESFPHFSLLSRFLLFFS